MNNFIPLMLKVPFSNGTCHYMPLTNVIVISGRDKYIDMLTNTANDKIYKLESVDGLRIDIRKLNCRSYDEFLVALDLNNLLHGGSLTNETKNDGKKKMHDLIHKVKQLKEENDCLKKKFNEMKKFFESLDTANAALVRKAILGN